MYPFIVSVVLYLFPPKVIAKFLVILMGRLAKSTYWTKVDDEFVAVLEARLSEGAAND